MCCPVCHARGTATRLAVVTTRQFRVERCTRCGLAYATPRPTPGELRAFYADEYFSGGHGGKLGYRDYGGESWAAANARSMWPLLKEWEPCLAKVVHAHLDIGCAEGDLGGAALSDGWAVSGVEPADRARQKAAARGLRTFATLEDVVGSYGLITMLHVLEHMIDPLAALRRAREVVAADGVLVVELPQWGSLGRRVRRSQWAQLKPPEHINFFNARSLSYALRATGWRVARCVTIQERPFALAATALRRRQLTRAVAYAAGGTVVERFGLGGYLRTSAIPDGRSATIR